MSKKGLRIDPMELLLLEKTELWIKPVIIKEVNLTLLAEKVAEVLNLKKNEVMVVDIRDDQITLDIIKKSITAENIIGKKKTLLNALKEIPGVSLLPETSIHTEGVLGLIDIEESNVAKEVIDRMAEMGQEILDKIKKRVIVFPSGFEIKKGLIQDTNSPYIRDRLSKEGYEVVIGETLEDDKDQIFKSLLKALEEGYGLIITTGGVGAEDKDHTIEAILKLDPNASTPYIIHYEKGQGRHQKDGVRIGVSYIHPSFIIALPGPHNEVRIGIETIIDGLKRGFDKEKLAKSLSQKYIQTLKGLH